MEEPELREYIQTLARRLRPRFEEEGMTAEGDAEARISAALEQPESERILERLTSALAAEPSSSPERKDLEVAKRNREDGNAAFQESS